MTQHLIEFRGGPRDTDTIAIEDDNTDPPATYVYDGPDGPFTYVVTDETHTMDTQTFTIYVPA